MMFDDYLRGLCVLAGSFLSYFLGGLDALLEILVVCIIADYVTGVMKGFVKHDFSSEVGFHGIAKKVCIFILLGIANVIDNYIGKVLGDTEILRDAIAMFYISNECLSITENAIELGLPVPESVKKHFREWNKQSGS